MFNRDVIKAQHHNRDSVEYTNKQNYNEFPELTNHIRRGGRKLCPPATTHHVTSSRTSCRLRLA